MSDVPEIIPAQSGAGPAAGKAASLLASLLSRGWRSGYFWIFAVALALRLVYLWQGLANNELITHPVVDAQVYVEWAQKFAAGNWLWYEPPDYTPGFPLWLALWITLLGWNPVAHFTVFHLLGAIQAVLIGKTAEMLWNRRSGLAAGWLAALYWPWILYEASHYAEPFAIFSLSLALFLIVCWTRGGRSPWTLLWAGFAFAWALLARANLMLCAPVLALWVAWYAARGKKERAYRRAAAAMLALLLPAVLMSLPIMFWNWKISGYFMLRAQGWSAVYLGNEPEFGALAPPAGERWWNYVYQPIRAGYVQTDEQETFRREQTIRVVTERTWDWFRFMQRKTLMLIGGFEVSQEIDIGVFRAASPVLSWPIWPGWGLVAPLALVASAAMARSPEARRGLPLLALAIVYFISISPVTVAARYRLPMLAPLLPLAGWTLIAMAGAWRRRQFRELAAGVILFALACIVTWPDWLGLGAKPIINHWFLVGQVRARNGDEEGALAAFEKGAEFIPTDPDCPLRMGYIWRDRGDYEKAERLFLRSRTNFPAGHQAIIGLGECALGKGDPGRALQMALEALQVAPNNMEALNLAAEAFAAVGDWFNVVRICAQMRSYPIHAASIDFTEAWALTLLNRPAEALARLDAVAEAPWIGKMDRDRAAFLGGALAWRSTGEKSEAYRRWQPLLQNPGLFQPLAEFLCGTKAEADLEALRTELQGRSKLYLEYTLGLRAAMEGNKVEARRHWKEMIEMGGEAGAAKKRDLLELWAAADLQQMGNE